MYSTAHRYSTANGPANGYSAANGYSTANEYSTANGYNTANGYSTANRYNTVVRVVGLSDAKRRLSEENPLAARSLRFQKSNYFEPYNKRLEESMNAILSYLRDRSTPAASSAVAVVVDVVSSATVAAFFFLKLFHNMMACR